MRSFAIAVAFFTATGLSMGDIVINEFLSLRGFVDMSYNYSDKQIDPAGTSGFNKTSNDFNFEEFETSLFFNYDPLTAQIDLEYEGNSDRLEIEQAFIVYKPEKMAKGASVTAGRYASMLGFEAYEPTGLYQYTDAYGGVLGDLYIRSLGVLGSVNLNPEASLFVESLLFPIGERYSQGIKYTHKGARTFFGISAQDGTISYDNRVNGDNDADSTAVDDGGYSLEAACSYDFGYGLTFFMGGSYETGDGITEGVARSGDTQTYTINTYSTLELGAWIFAAELNFSESKIDDVFDPGADADLKSLSGLLMTNYAYNETASMTGRLSYMELDGELDASGGAALDGYAFKYTLAHNYALTENLSIVAEFSYTDGRFDSTADGNGDLEEFFAAAEIIFTF